MQSHDHTPPECSEADLPPATPVLDEHDIAAIARGLSHPARVRIVNEFLVCTPHLVQEIVESSNLAQSTISEHLRILRDADILFARKEGPRSWYCLRRSVLREFATAILELADDSALDTEHPLAADTR